MLTGIVFRSTTRRAASASAAAVARLSSPRPSAWSTGTGAARRPFASASASPKDEAEAEEEEFAADPTASEPPAFAPRKANNKDLNDLPINFADIMRAEVAIRGGVKRTTCERSHFISELVGANVYLKDEFRQFTGSFKERGARNAILQLMREQGSSLRGVIAASAGNHALALAYHGKELGVPVTVVMPTVAPMAKVDKCRVS